MRAESLAALPWLAHGFSTRLHPRSASRQPHGAGDFGFNLGFTAGAERATVERNRAAFLEALGAANGRGKPWPLVTLRQVHSDVVRVIAPWGDVRPRTLAGTVRLPGDGAITSAPGIALAIQTADCLPVLVADARQRVVAAFHAGWRGTLKRIVERGVGSMHMLFGSRPADLRAAIGPGIHACCYQVGEEVRDLYRSQFTYSDELAREVFDVDPVRRRYPLLFLNARAPGHAEVSRQIHLDLVEANRRQLLAAGVAPEHISVAPLCTRCRTDLLFSYRAEGARTGRLLAVLGIRRSAR